MNEITCKFAETDAERAGIREIWHEVFVEEQNIPEDRVYENDSGAGEYEVIALNGSDVIGTARFVFPERGIAKIERMAVLKPYRKTGAGKALISFIIKYLKEQQISKIILHAQHTVVGFYRSCGFTEVGDWFVEVNIRHIEMEMFL